MGCQRQAGQQKVWCRLSGRVALAGSEAKQGGPRQRGGRLTRSLFGFSCRRQAALPRQ